MAGSPDHGPASRTPQLPLTETACDLPVNRVGVDLRRLPLFRFDVLVLGSGVAGASAALAAASDGAQVGLLTKAPLHETNTWYAQGGMATVIGAEDSFDSHVEDTLKVGCGLSERSVVERIVREGPAALERLLGWGTLFDRSSGGELERSREGGHSHPRVLHAGGDATGQSIQRAAVTALLAHPSIAAFPEHFAVQLLSDQNGGVCGLLAITDRGERVGFTASQVILATGGAGQIYRETTNPPVATGDGVALALRAGALIRDPEFFQFHPTCLYIAGAARVLISEIVRGAGGVLRDRTGDRFMPAFHPDAELAPRDVVSRAVAQRMHELEDSHVFLDLSDVDGDPHLLFPNISRVCRFFGIDIAREPIPVRPGQHYMVGGVQTDADGRTTVPGLWAVGECASSGLHGANRMGSNSLLEGAVLGHVAGREAAAAVRDVARGSIRSLPEPMGSTASGIPFNLEDVTYALKSLMWRHVGVRRTGKRLAEALPQIDLWTRAVGQLGDPEPATWELLNMLDLARLTIIGALSREESRGVHFRADHPETDPLWRVHTSILARIVGDRLERLELGRETLEPGSSAAMAGGATL
jgi:L-aspartate oxidase